MPDAFFDKCAADFVQAIERDLYPAATEEEIWGVQMSQEPITSHSIRDVPFGALIYSVYQEIYKYRMYQSDPCGQSTSQRFQHELKDALKFWTLPQKFEEWTRQIVDDPDYHWEAYSSEMVRRGFSTEMNLVNPYSEGHRKFMVAFTRGPNWRMQM